MPAPADTRPIVLLGPTAGGKSDLAAALAERLGGEVIGADSMQVYRHLDAGTAKPPPALRQRVPHRLIDIVEPTQRFTVHDWLTRATAEITRVQASGGTPVIVGGTNLYLKALLDGLFDGPGQDPCFRATLDGTETPALHDRLRQIDPDTADRVKPADRQRIVRALEVYALTGQPISALQTQWEDGRCPMSDVRDENAEERHRTSNIGHRPFRLLGLRWSAERINPRINLRVKAMFYPRKVDPALAEEVCLNGESLIEETRRLKDEGRFAPLPSSNHPSRTAPNQAREALGYKQLLAVIERTDPKLRTIDDAYERTKILTRRFAKQQRTWLKRFTGTYWLDCDHAEPAATAEAALAWAEHPDRG
jgi:tRNA dimethylallyltransferase